MLKTLLNSVRILFTTLLIFSFSINTSEAQESSQIVETYKAYTTPAREVVYLHLNKSTYISGEPIGFTAYVLDKKSKQPSFITTNLYVSIEDKNETVLKQKLIKVTDGVASNTFEVDSTFSSGNYKIKAYTNWMLNFDEKNYFSESIRILNPDNENDLSEKRIDNKVDAQFLPESGHLLNGVINIVGVVIKDQLGFGIPYAKGEVVDKNDELLTTFKTNQFGIGKFQLLPEIGNHYKVNISNNNKDFSFLINHNIENKGILISLKSLNSKVFVSLITNNNTLASIKNKKHTLLIHNGDEYNAKDIFFTNKTEIITTIEYSNVATGINTLTLFNDNDQPIAERLFFNYEGLNIIKSDGITAKKTKDSVALNLSFKDINTDEFNAISISVLPQETKSYNRHHNIISYTYLEPYVNGTIEQAKYYFTNIDDKKKHELDNLLLTQGWSSYNWNTIFNHKMPLNDPFEQGITVKANLTDKDFKDTSDLNYVLHAVNNDAPKVLNVQKPNKSFVIENIFPEDNHVINLSKVTKNKGLQPAMLYLQYFPRMIPPLKNRDNVLPPKSQYILEQSFKTESSYYFFELSHKVQKLNEVTVSTKSITEKRQEELSRLATGKITIMDDQNIKTYRTLTNYLSSHGLIVSESIYGFSVRTSGRYPIPLVIYMNGKQLLNTYILRDYDLSQIDYLEIHKSMSGIGLYDSFGAVRLYTHKEDTRNTNKTKLQSYTIPLAFSAEKKYYVPKYRNTGDSFYKSYGVVDWKTFNDLDKNNNVNLKITSPSIPITLYIDGITNDGSFIIEEKTLILN
ncbi:hypothetical protein [Winogradskyella psychrotolerans]|uniref:hypothetical protein n=1 Tax=Winogradskyella psychrotolerans TaxID=1344585 RepID=UPI001C078891|nr:hypothetical protein [Winogradskyella psychrotolerans]MBU2926935.1 hypothetical protein [Winogradskyella psychrotolerans]